MNTFLIKTITDLENLIRDYRARMIVEKDFKKEIRAKADDILNGQMDEQIEEDLKAGLRVMGRMRNPKTGEVEEMSETGVICQKCGGHWLWGFARDMETFFCPKCSKDPTKLVPVGAK